MKQEHRQLVLNKKEDWQGCYFSGTVISGDSVRMADDAGSRGYFVTRAIDSGENGFAWRRVTLDTDLPRDTLICTLAYASDSLSFENTENINSYMRRTDENDELLRRMFGEPIAYSDDFYINKAGRYLWMVFMFISTGESTPSLNSIRLHFPGDHMTQYLPAIYGGSFTYRFVSIFDSFFMDMEKNIYGIPERFDFERSEGKMLRYLAEFVNIDTRGLTDSEIRSLIRTAHKDAEDMYTRHGLSRTVRRLTGRVPVIIEHFEVSPNLPGCSNPELYRRLYGENPFKFFVLLEDDTFTGKRELELFIETMRGYTPAHMQMELVLLKHCVQLDWHTYLGLNSYVGSYVPVSIDENKTIHYDSIVGGDKN